MRTEIEVKFLDVDHDKVRAQLKELGGVCELPMRLMKRAIIDYPDHRLQTDKNAYIRVRDEGQKVTLTYKQFKGQAVDSAREIEAEVDSFEDTIKIFEAIGLKVRSFQESKRETWKLGKVEVVLDEWPWLKPYLEIEGESEAELRAAAQRLGFDWQDAVFGDVMAAYRIQYPHLTDADAVGGVPEVRFDTPLPDLFKP